jgi:N-acetylglucosamine-6-phosphate deacetylase
VKRRLIKGGTVFTPREELRADVLIEGSRITRVEAEIPADGAEVIEAAGRLIAPGHIDLHVQGHEGRDFWEKSYEATNEVSVALPKHGVTGITATTDGLPENLSALAEGIERGVDGTPILGIHSEGPFVNAERLGAMEKEKVCPVDLDHLKRLLEAGGGHVRIMTIAPEIPGTLEAIALLAQQGIVASLGHSQGSYEEACAGFEAGARRVTHLFNAMTSFSDRADGGLAAAALLRDDISVEVVSDCVHLHPAMLKIVARVKGAEKAAAVTDSVKVAGLPAGRYESGGHGYEVFVEEAGQPPRLADGTIAGSGLSMDRAVRNLVNVAGLSLLDAFTMASFAPAATLGLLGQKGEIAPGRDADIVIYSGELAVLRTLVGGETKFEGNN